MNTCAATGIMVGMYTTFINDLIQERESKHHEPLSSDKAIRRTCGAHSTLLLFQP
jgi:hypothetical protein